MDDDASFDNSEVGYTGHRASTDAGLVDMGLRHYDPVMRRFTSPDPVVPNPLDPQSWNRYAYARGNPSTFTDPTGAAPALCDRNCGAGAISSIPGVALGFGVATVLSTDFSHVGRGLREFGEKLANIFDRGHEEEPRLVVVSYAPIGSDSINFEYVPEAAIPSALPTARNAEAHGPVAPPSFGLQEYVQQREAAQRAAEIAKLGVIYDSHRHPHAWRPGSVPFNTVPVIMGNGSIIWQGPMTGTGGDYNLYYASDGSVVGDDTHGGALGTPMIDPYDVVFFAGAAGKGLAKAGGGFVAGVFRQGGTTASRALLPMTLRQQKALALITAEAREELLADFAKVAAGLSEGEIAAATRSPELFRLFFGHAIEKRIFQKVSAALLRDPNHVLKGVSWTGKSNAAADFIIKEFAIDVTGGSTSSILKHSARAGVDAVVTYDSVANYVGWDFARWVLGG